MSTQNDKPGDETGDDEVSALYRKADGALPPASLNESIVAAAHQAVAEKPATRKSARAPFSGHWPVAVSAAAVFIIAVILAPSIEQESPLPDTTFMQTGEDESRNAAEQAGPKKTARERMPLPSPSQQDATQSPPAAMFQQAMEATARDEDSIDTTGRSATAANAADIKAESAQPRAQVRLDAAGGAPLAIFTPEMWLVKIQQLLDSGKLGEAADELDRFRRAHPDYELDDRLLEQLKRP